MPFVSRARSYYASKDVVKAVITLIEGLKRFPERTEAFRWLIDLYCDEVPSTGLEEDLVNVVDVCPDPEGVYAWIFQRLQRNGRQRFIKRLDRARRESALARGLPWEEWSVLVQRVSASQVEAVAAEPEPEPAPLPLPQAAPEVAELTPALAWGGAPVAAVAQASGGSPTLGNLQPLPAASPAPAPASPPTPGAAWGSPAWLGDGALLPLKGGLARGGEDRFEEPIPDALSEAPPTPRRPAPPTPPADPNLPAHPFLLERQQRRDRRTDELPLGEGWRADRGAGDAPPARARAAASLEEVPDMDALRALEETPAARGAGEVTWRPEPATPARGGLMRRRLIWLLLLIALAGAALAVFLYRSEVIAEKRSAVETSDANAERFVLEEILQAEAQLAEALQRDPGAAGVAARLRWTRALRGYLQAGEGAPASSADPAEPEPRLAAWYLAAQTLDALQANQGDAAAQRLNALRAAEPACPDLPQGMSSWLEGEFHLRAAEPARAGLAYERAASYGFAPGAVSLADLRLRQGDPEGLRVALDQLAGLSPEHPVVALGAAALPRLEEALTGRPTPAPGVPPAALLAVQGDRRFPVWTALATGEGDLASLRDAAPHPTLHLLAARDLLRAGRVEEATPHLEAVDPDRAAAPLRAAHQRLSSEGFRDAGRPDMALRFLPEPPTHEAELREWVNARAEEALLRAALLAELGRFEEARALLALLLRDPVRAPAARVIALQLHLHEGRVDDVRRHAERLKDHRGALVASAAIDLYQGRDAAALAILGPWAPPSRDEDPQLTRFEVRTRLLALRGAQRPDAIRAVLQAAPAVPHALAARVHPDPEAARVHADLAAQGEPTALSDLIDLAAYALEREAYEDAERWAARILESSPESTEGHRIMAALLLHTRRAPAAIPHARAATRGRPDLASLHLVAPEVELKQGAPLKAAVDLQRWLDQHPTDTRAIDMLGRAWLQARHLARGAKDFERRLTLLDERNDREAAGTLHYWLGRLHKSALGEARGGQHLRRARDLLGDDPRLLAALADYHRHRDPTHALELYRAALASPQPPPEALLAFGRFAFHRGMRRDAADALQRYLPLADNPADRAWAAERLGELR